MITTKKSIKSNSYTITLLGPTAQREYDPYYKEILSKKTRFTLGASYFDKPSPFLKDTPDAIFDEFDRIFLPQLEGRHSDILSYENEMRKKCGAQGGKIAIAQASTMLRSYYEYPRGQKFYFVNDGLRSLLYEIRAKKRLVGIPQPIWEYQFRDTAGGLPTCLKKNFVLGNSYYYLAHAEAFNWFGELWPTLVSFRRMRNKDRLVFMDSALNVDRIEPIMSAVRNWFKQYYPELFAALHRPQRYLWRKITRCMNRKFVNLETDFSAMDQSMTLTIARKVLLPILKELLIPSDYLSASVIVEQYFTQKVLLGDQLWEGKHALFSGQVITQDLENFYDICLYLGVFQALGYSFDDFMELFTMVGDDVLAFFKSLADAEVAYNLIREETSLNKVPLSEEKTRMNTSEVRFCRNVYSVHTARILDDNFELVIPPVYMLSLATNSIVQPERLNPNFGNEVAAIIARSDNARYHPLWKSWATWLYSKLKIPFLPTEQQFQEYQVGEWWSRVYGETYNLSQSPTYQLWMSLVK